MIKKTFFRDIVLVVLEKKKFLFHFFLSIFIVLWLLEGFFVISPNERGVVMRFGKYHRDANPGLNYKLPEPLETMEKVSVTRIRKDLIGQKTGLKHQMQRKIKRIKYVSSKESQMLTGDENIIDMHLHVQWRIEDPKNYLFNIENKIKNQIVKIAAESIVRQMIGGVNISEALSEKRLVLEDNVKKYLQLVLDGYGAGIEVMGIGILYSYVAPEVRGSYSDVQSAKADKEKYINLAQAYRNNLLPRAKGRARSIIESGLAYKEAQIAKARGEGERFKRIINFYRVNEDITKKRMYLESMQKIYKKADKIIIDGNMIKNILPILPINRNIIK